MDLPCDDYSAGTQRYAEVVIAALADVDDDVVVVGHSLGGLTIPLVAAGRPVRRVVYLCGVIRAPGETLNDANRRDSEQPGRLERPTSNLMVDGLERGADGSSRWTNPAIAIEAMYQDCTPEDGAWAFSKLRLQCGVGNERNPLSAWPATQYSYVLCQDDLVMTAPRARRLAKMYLHVDPIEMPGHHSPMLARPAQLADILDSLAR